MGTILSKITYSILAFVMVASAVADDEVARAKLKDATALYAERADAEKLTATLELLAKAENEAQDKTLKHDILILQTRCLYFQAQKSTDQKQKLALHEKGRTIAQAARDLNDTAEGYYWDAAHLSRWANLIGIPKNLFQRPTLFKLLDTIPKKITRDGSPGVTYEGYGSSRIYGRVHFKLPAIFEGKYDLAIKYLKLAHEKAPDFAANTSCYADALYAKKPTRAEAKKIVDELLKKDPRKLNLNRIPETEDEFKEAKEIRANMVD